MLLRCPSRSEPRRGVVLLAVLIVVVLLSLAAYKYNDWMVAEYRATDSAIRASQARAFAQSGVAYTMAQLAGKLDETLGGNPWDNPGAFSGIAVPTTGKNPRLAGRFYVLSLRSPDEISQGGQAFRFGVTDESGKINVNALLLLDNGRGEVGRQLLMALPNMTEDIANAILDWIDPDETPRQFGAENEHYGTLSPPYRCKNGPVDSLEELLLVKGVTPGLLFGNDRNRNGIIDESEQGDSVDLGWQAYLTVYSRELNLDSDNQPRININDRDINALSEKLYAALPQELADYIVAYRMYGGSSTTTNARTRTASLSGGDRSQVQGQLRTGRQSQNRRNTNIASLWDLVNSTVNVPNGNSTTAFPSPLNDLGQQKTLLPVLFDKCTTSQNMEMAARININSASQAVLMGLKEPGRLSDGDIQTIFSQRPSSDAANSDPAYQSIAWLLTEANLPLETVKRLEPYITTRTQVYRFQVVGVFDEGGPISRIEAVVDANQGRPRVVYWRDLSELGKGFDLSGGGQ